MSWSQPIRIDREYWYEDEDPFMEVDMEDYYDDDYDEDKPEDERAELFEKYIIKKSRIPSGYFRSFNHEMGILIDDSYKDIVEKPAKDLAENISKLLNDQDTADFTLKTNTKSFRIHKLIFGARSCVFQAMFQANMAEGQAGEATIEDLDDDTLEEMIHFIYTGRLSGKQLDKLSLLYAAKKYQLDSLKDLVILDLEVDLDIDQGTAEEPGKLADIFIASKLFEDLFDIVMWRMKKEMLEDASFKEKMEDHPVLLSKIKEKL